MECAICFEKFLKPSREEYIKLVEEEMKKVYKDPNLFMNYINFVNLLITPKHNTTHTCSTPNCNIIICHGCWHKITHNGKNMLEVTMNDVPSKYDLFKCPYCKQIDWKDYMKNVLNELQQKKVLGKEEYIEYRMGGL